MKLVIKIDLGNEEMQTPEHVRKALVRSKVMSGSESPYEDGDEGLIFDENGNSVGSWYVVD